MGIIKWGPWWPEELENFDKNFKEFSQGFRQLNGFTPAIDIYQNKNNIIVEIPLPGINPEKVEISVENDILTIKGTSQQKKEIEEKEYYRKEIKTGGFFRSVFLPAHVISDKIEASYNSGILKIIAPKIKKKKAKNIKIKIIKNKEKK